MKTVLFGFEDFEEAIINDVCDFFSKKFFRKDLSNNITAFIYKSKLDCFGLCTWEDDYIKPREFSIDLNQNLNKFDLISTLLHELIHIKQFVRGEKKERYRGGHVVLWDGVDYLNVEYGTEPREIEAFEMEPKLTKEYIMDTKTEQALKMHEDFEEKIRNDMKEVVEKMGFQVACELFWKEYLNV